MKHYKDNDFVVCEYIDKGSYLNSIVLGQYRDRELVYKGYMTLGVSREAFAVIKAQPQRQEPPFAQPSPSQSRQRKCCVAGTGAGLRGCIYAPDQKRWDAPTGVQRTTAG